MDDIIARLSALTIPNLATTLPIVASMETVEQALNQLTLNGISILTPPSSPPAALLGFSSTTLAPDGNLKNLCLLDARFDSHMKSIICSLDELASPSPSSQSHVEVSLLEEKQWLQASIRGLQGLQHHCNAEIWVLAEAMQDRMVEFTSGIDLYLEVLGERSPLQSSPIINTSDLPCYSSV
jgi:hypothetical protein